jgi:hypothetical protein
MSDIAEAMAMIVALAAPVEISDQPVQNWCTPGYTVMLPEGREGVVTSTAGEICRVMADGEKYVTLIPHYIVEPVYPQAWSARAYR